MLEFLKQNHIHSASKLYLIYYLNSTFKIYLSQPESPHMCVRAYVYFILQVRNGNCSFSCTLDPTSGKHWRSTLWKCISVNLRLTLSTSCSHHEEYLGTEYSIPPFTTKHRLLESHPGWNSPHYYMPSFLYLCKLSIHTLLCINATYEGSHYVDNDWQAKYSEHTIRGHCDIFGKQIILLNFMTKLYQGSSTTCLLI